MDEVDRLSPGQDDQLDLPLLCKPELPDWRPTIPAYDLSSHMGAYLEHLSGRPIPPESLLPAQCVLCIPPRVDLTLQNPIHPIPPPRP